MRRRRDGRLTRVLNAPRVLDAPGEHPKKEQYMATVHVVVKNNSGNTVTLQFDDEKDAERIEYLKKLVRREDLADVKVVGAKVPAKTAVSPKS